jgi:hypothetical protein
MNCSTWLDARFIAPAAVLAACLSVTPVAAAPILDQSFDAPSFLAFGFGGDVHLAQTFTVGLAGVLTRVDLEIRRDSGIPDVLFDVRPTEGGVPVESDALALVSLTIPNTSIPTSFSFLQVDFSSTPIPVSVGDVLAVVLRAPGEGSTLNYGWQASFFPQYVSGDGFFREVPSGSWTSLFGDFSFQTFVDPAATVVPEPAAFLLVGSGLAILRRKLKTHRAP